MSARRIEIFVRGGPSFLRNLRKQYIFLRNESVVTTTTRPESTLMPLATIDVMKCKEAAGHVRVGWIDGINNLADALTKVTVGQKQHYLFSRILH
jgi:hypothetical protein